MSQTLNNPNITNNLGGDNGVDRVGNNTLDINNTTALDSSIEKLDPVEAESKQTIT